MNSGVSLVEVDEVRITVIMDNVVDLLMVSYDIVSRYNINPSRRPPIAEHGFSMLIEVRSGNKKAIVILDAGITSEGTLHNLDTLGVDLKEIEAIIVSHGHNDHILGLPGLIDRFGSQQLSLVYHPDALLEKKIIMPNGDELYISYPIISGLRRNNITFLEKVEPTLLGGNMILVSGEIERTTDFEKGFPIHYVNRNGNWEHDPLVKDDQCVILNLRGKGLVIITGCGHSGVINTIRFAQTLTNIQQVHAVIGGFHLTGGVFEEVIPATVAALQTIKPAYLMPGHCTGWQATHQIAAALPKAFIPNCVGTTLFFKG